MKKQIKKTRHLDYYKDCLATGNMKGDTGLCWAARNRRISIRLLDKCMPTLDNLLKLQREGKSITFWGSDSSNPKIGTFTPLRQTIVLFMAALNDEL